MRTSSKNFIFDSLHKKSVLKKIPNIKNKELFRILSYLIEREAIHLTHQDEGSLMEVRKLLVYIATNFETERQ